MNPGPPGPLVESHTGEEYLADFMNITGGKTDVGLAPLAIRMSEECPPWMERHGVRVQPSMPGTLSRARTNAFFLGARVEYEAAVTELELDDGRVVFIDYTQEGQTHRRAPTSVVVAAGGFHADTDWLARAWGPAAKSFLIRGTPYNRGVVLADLLDQGVERVGDPTQCHARRHAPSGGALQVPSVFRVHEHGHGDA